MNEPKNINQIKEELLKQIRCCRVRIKPKIYFLLKTLLAVAGLMLIVGITVYLVSFIAFVLDANGILELADLGMRGLALMLGSFPWILILLVAALIIIIELQMKYFAVVYRRPLIYSLLAVCIVVIASGAIIGKTTLHDHIASYARQQHIPLLPVLYESYDAIHPREANFGTVSEIQERTFRFRTMYGETLSVEATEPHLMLLKPVMKPGDCMMVIGKRQDNIVIAQHIKQLSPARPVCHRKKILRYEIKTP